MSTKNTEIDRLVALIKAGSVGEVNASGDGKALENLSFRNAPTTKVKTPTTRANASALDGATLPSGLNR